MPSPPIAIPAAQKPAFDEITRLSDDAFQALLACLADGRVDAEPQELVDQTAEKMASHTALGGHILSAVVGLRMAMDRSALKLNDVAKGVADDAVKKQWVEPSGRDVLSRRITSLLSTHKVQVAAKAYSLANADAAPFIEARIITDIRPIFSDNDDGLGLSGSVIIHQLRIEVDGYEANQHSALSTSDLLKLKRVVDRALEKDRSLRETIKKSVSALTPLETSSSK